MEKKRKAVNAYLIKNSKGDGRKKLTLASSPKDWARREREREREREIRMIYSFRPLPLHEGVRVDDLPPHSTYYNVPMSKKTNKLTTMY